MRNLKRVLTISLALVMLLVAMSVSSFAATTKFVDVNTKDEALTQAVSLLEGLGITKGTSEDTFGTNEYVTREQMAAFVYRLMKAGKSPEGGENTTPFEDLYDDTYFTMISWTNAMGIIKGVSATEFNPDGGIILQDAYAMLVRALGYEKNEQLAYPHGYIGVAEQKGLELGEGLPSKVGYTTKLTRGNVAVLLYNAFYAELAEKKTVEREILVGTGVHAKYILQTTEENPKLCEEIFGVLETEYQIVETTHYAFNPDPASPEQYKPTKDNMGENTVLLVAKEGQKGVKLGSFYTTLEELGIEGTADSLIMSGVNVYYTYDDKEKKLDEILFAETLMQKESATSAKFASVEATDIKNDPEHRYSPYTSRDSQYRRLDGSMTVEGKTFYFYDAPYSYLKPSYAKCETEQDRYDVRNADNAKLIDLKCLDVDEGLYSYYVTNDVFASKDGYDTDYDSKYALKFSQIRTGGIYKIDIFDPDGDGRYEYVWYKPASFAKIIMDDEYEFAETDGVVKVDSKEIYDTLYENSLSTVPVLYANGAKLTGVAFNDEDFVVAYVNSDANMIDVIGVATGNKGMLTDNDKSNGVIKIGNKSFRTCYQVNFLKDFFIGDRESATLTAGDAVLANFSHLLSHNALGMEIIVYTYKHSHDNVVYFEVASAGVGEYTGENILIPIEAETVSQRNSETFSTTHYLKVLLDGKEQYIPVDVEECYPAPTLTANRTYKFDNVITSENGYKYEAYLNKLCTYEVDKNGVYTIHSLIHGEDEDGDCDHLPLEINENKFYDENKTSQFANDLGIYPASEVVKLKQSTSRRYLLTDAHGYNMFGTYDGDYFEEAYVTDTTVFMIRSFEENKDGEIESEIITYTGTEFPGTVKSNLVNVQFICENYGDSKKTAKLVLFYGEVENEGKLEFETKTTENDYRIVKSARAVKIADKEFRYRYDLFNLATGELETEVLGTFEASTANGLANEGHLPAGSVINLTKDGSVDDAEALGFVIDVESNLKFLEITDVDVDSGVFEANTWRGAIDDEYFTDEETGAVFNLYELDEDVVVSVLKFGKTGDYDTAEVKPLTLAELAEANKDIKSYTTKYEDEDGDLSTKYCKNIKAYVTYTKKAKDDFPVVDTIIVIVTPDETTNLDIK